MAGVEGAGFRPAELHDLVVLHFDAFDWHEEDEPIFGHPGTRSAGSICGRVLTTFGSTRRNRAGRLDSSADAVRDAPAAALLPSPRGCADRPGAQPDPNRVRLQGCCGPLVARGPRCGPVLELRTRRPSCIRSPTWSASIRRRWTSSWRASRWGACSHIQLTYPLTRPRYRPPACARRPGRTRSRRRRRRRTRACRPRRRGRATSSDSITSVPCSRGRRAGEHGVDEVTVGGRDVVGRQLEGCRPVAGRAAAAVAARTCPAKLSLPSTVIASSVNRTTDASVWGEVSVMPVSRARVWY